MAASDAFRFHLVKYFKRRDAKSRREIAKLAGISHVHVLHILSGRSVPTLSVAESLSHAIGADLSELLRR